MTSFDAVGIAEGFIEARDEDQVIEAGSIWSTLVLHGNCKVGSDALLRH
jgi:hypothetical protein